MSAYKRFGGSGIGTRQLREIYDRLEELESEIVDLSNQEVDVASLTTNRVIYKDSTTSKLVTSDSFYYDGSYIGFNTIPEPGVDFDISGVTFLRGNIQIDGSLTVLGTQTTINTNELDVSTNYININEGMTGAPPLGLKSGIRVNRGDEPDYMFEFSELHDLFRVGISGGDMNPVTERELVFQDRVIPIWDAVSSTQGRLTYNSQFVMDESGNLGIGTSTPNGDKVVIQDNSPSLVLYDPNSGTINLEFIRGNRTFGNDAFTDWRLRSQAGRLRIDGAFNSIPTDDVVVFSTANGGRMGIQVEPTAELDVSGQTYLRGIVGIRTVADPLYSLTVHGDVSMGGNLDVDIYFPTDASGINARVRDISQNLSDLSGVVDTNIQNINDISQNLSDLSGVVDTNIQDINDISQNLSDLSGVVDTNIQDILDISQNLSDLSGVVDTNIQDINDISQNLSDLSGVVDTNIQDINDISQNLSDLSGVVDTNIQDINDISQNLSDLSGVVDTNIQNINDISQNLSDLSGVVDTNIQDILDISQNLSDLSGVVDTNIQDINDISQNLSDLSGVVDTNIQDINDISQNLSDLSGVVDTNIQDINDISQNLSDLSGVVDTNIQDILDISQNLSDLSGVVDTNIQNINDISQNLSDLSGVVDTNIQDINDISQNLSDLSGVVDTNIQDILDVSQNLSDLSGVVDTTIQDILDVSQNLSDLSGVVDTTIQDILDVSQNLSDLSGVVDTTIQDILDVSQNLSDLSGVVDTTIQDILDVSQNVSILQTDVSENTTTHLYQASSGVYEGGIVTLASPTSISISAGKGLINDGSGITLVEWTDISNYTIPNISTNDFTQVYIDTSSNVYLENISPTPITRRSYIYLAKLVHEGSSLFLAFTQPQVLRNGVNGLHDYFENISNFIVLSGGTISANSDLQLDFSEASIYGIGINFSNAVLNPNIKTLSAQSDFVFRYRFLDSTESVDTSFVDPDNYESSPGTLTAVPSNQFTNQHIYMFPTGIIRIQYGQQTYNKLVDAVDAIPTEPFVLEDNIEDNGVLLSVLTVKEGTTSLSSSTDAIFTQADQFGRIGNGGGIGGGAGITDLQTAYTFEDDGYIELDGTKPFGIKDQTTNTMFSVNNDSTITMNATIDFSCNSLQDVSRITFCPSGTILEESDFFDICSTKFVRIDNVTVDTTSGRLGVGTTTPQRTVHFAHNSSSTLMALQNTEDPSANGNNVVVSFRTPMNGNTFYESGAIQHKHVDLSSSQLQFYTTDNLSLNPVITAKRQYVGINVEDPSYILHVKRVAGKNPNLLLEGDSTITGAPKLTFQDVSSDITYTLQQTNQSFQLLNDALAEPILQTWDTSAGELYGRLCLFDETPTYSTVESVTGGKGQFSAGVGIWSSSSSRASQSFFLMNQTNVNNASRIAFHKNNGLDYATAGDLSNTDILYYIWSYPQVNPSGSPSVNYVQSSAIIARMDNDVSNNRAPTALTFSTMSQTENNTERMRITSTGNVGIGSAIPNNKLEIIGSTTVPDITDGGYVIAANTDRYGMILEVSGNTTDSATMWLKNDTPGASPSTLFRINNNGNVGIGTNTPISVIGSTVQVKDGAIVAGDTNTTSGNVALYPYYTDSTYTCCYGAQHSSGGAMIGYGVRSTSGNITSISSISLSRTYLHVSTDLEWWTGTTGAYAHGTTISMTKRFYVDNSGNLYVTSGTINSISENKKKTDIQPLHRSIKTLDTEDDMEVYRQQTTQFMDKVDALQGVEYGLTTQNSSMKTIGLKAEQVEQSFPELINKIDDGSLVGKEKQMSLVDYNGMIGILLETIKSLKEEVKDLKNLVKANDGNTQFKIPKQTTYTMDGSLNTFDTTSLKQLFTNNNFTIYMVDSAIDNDGNSYMLGLAYFTAPIRKNESINFTQKSISFIVKYTHANQLDTSFGVDASGVSLLNNISRVTHDDGTRPDLYLDEFIIGRRIVLHNDALYVTGRYAFTRFRFNNDTYSQNFVSAFMLIAKYNTQGVLDTSFRSNQPDTVDGSSYGYFFYEQLNSGYYIINLAYYYQEYLVDVIIQDTTLYAVGYAIRDYNNEDINHSNYNPVDLYEGILVKLNMTEEGYKRPFVYRFSYTNETLVYRLFYDVSNTLFMIGTTFVETGIYESYVAKLSTTDLLDQSDMSPSKPLPTFTYNDISINTVQDTDYTADGNKATAIRCPIRTAIFNQTTKQIVLAGDETWYDASLHQHNTIYLCRVNSNVTIDTSFGTNGFSRIEITPNKYTNEFARNEGIEFQALNLERRSFHTLVEVENGYLLTPTYKAVLQLEYSLRRPISEGVLISITPEGQLNTQFGEYVYEDGKIQTTIDGRYVQKGYKMFHSALNMRSPLNTRELITSIQTDNSMNVLVTGSQEIPRGLAYFLTSTITNNTGRYSYTEAVTVRENTEQIYEFVSLDSNQRVLLAGEFQWIDPETGYLRMNIFLERRLSNSRVDTTFGTNGRILLNLRNYPLQRVYAIREDPVDENYVLISGYVGNQSNTDAYASVYIARVGVDGILDASFGESSGYTITSIDMKSSDFVWNMVTDISENHKQHDEYRILLSGFTSLQPDIDDDYKSFILCYTQYGFLDTTFQGANVSTGIAVPRIELSTDIEEYAYNVFVQSGDRNRYILGGDSAEYYDDDNESNIYFNAVVYGYTMNGELDVSFGGKNGDPSGCSIVRIATTTTDNTNEMFSMNQDSEKRIILAGHIDFQCALVCLTKDGELDTTFGENGKTIFSFRNNNNTILQTIIFTSAIDEQDRIYVAGYTNGRLQDNNNDDETTDDVETTILNNLVLARFTKDGVLDTTFGENGKGYRVQQTSSIDQIYYSTIDTVNGKLHLCGYTEFSDRSNGFYAKWNKREISTFNI